MAPVKKGKEKSSAQKESLALFVGAALDASRHAPTQAMARALLEGLVASGWNLAHRAPAISDVVWSGRKASEVAASAPAPGGRSTMAWALGELGVDWNMASKNELAPMALAAYAGNWPALEAMGATGGDWLGRGKRGAACRPVDSPMAGLWRALGPGKSSRFFRGDEGGSLASQEARIGALRQASWLALEEAVQSGAADPGSWASQVGACLLTHDDGRGLERALERQSAKLWSGLVRRCAQLGWRLEGVLEEGSHGADCCLVDMGLEDVERPTLALALAVRAGQGDPWPLTQALQAGVVDLDSRTAWALGEGARTRFYGGAAQAMEGFCSAVEALGPWRDALVQCQERPTFVFGRRSDADANFCLGSVFALALCPSWRGERASPKIQACRAKMARSLPLLGLEPGAPGWAPFTREWALAWERQSGRVSGEGWRNHAPWLWAGKDEREKLACPSAVKAGAWPKIGAAALAALEHWALQSPGAREMAIEALAGWAHAEERRWKQAKDDGLSSLALARWAMSAKAAGLAEGEAACSLERACDAGLARCGTSGRSELTAARVEMEARALSSVARGPAKRGQGPSRL